jgi:hypothetical protein
MAWELAGARCLSGLAADKNVRAGGGAEKRPVAARNPGFWILDSESPFD